MHMTNGASEHNSKGGLPAVASDWTQGGSKAIMNVFHAPVQHDTYEVYHPVCKREDLTQVLLDYECARR